MANIHSTLAVTLNDKLQRDRRTADSPIEAIDENGVIVLTGYARSHRARAAAAEIAARQPDVVSVINDLVVDDPEATEEVAIVPPLPLDWAKHNEFGPS